MHGFYHQSLVQLKSWVNVPLLPNPPATVDISLSVYQGNQFSKPVQVKRKIPAGRLVLVLGETNALGNAYDIDLLLLLKSSLLINAFDEPPATMSKIGLAVYSQQLKLKNKYNALIGDAPTDKNLQMWVLGSSQNKKSK